MMLIQMTGLSGAGKTTLAQKVRALLETNSHAVAVIDGDEYRKTLCKDLGFSKEDRHENIRRLGKLAFEKIQEKQVVLIAAINPYESIRRELKEKYSAQTVWVHCSIAELFRRDTKGLYKKTLLPDDDPGKVKNLTGVNDTFETPTSADLVIDTGEEDADRSAQRLYDFIISGLQR